MERPVLDARLWRYLFYFFIVSFVLSTVSGALGKWNESAYTTFTWGQMVLSIFLRYLLKFLFIMAAIVSVRWLVVKKYIPGWLGLLVHVVFAIGLTFYSVFSQILLYNVVFGYEEDMSWQANYVRAVLGTDYNFFLYFSMIAIVYA